MKTINLNLPSGNLWAIQNEPGFYTYEEAIKKFGDSLPTREDFEELLKYAYYREWNSERKGLEILAKNGAELFLPAVGMQHKGVRYNGGVQGNYWASSEACDNRSACLTFNEWSSVSAYFKFAGFSVRLIQRQGKVVK